MIGASPSEATPAEPLHRQAARYVWALLPARIHVVLPLLCPKCGGEMKIIAFITEGAVIRGALAMTLKACGDKRAFVLPKASANEAALVRDAVLRPALSLLEVCAHLLNRGALEPQPATSFDIVTL